MLVPDEGVITVLDEAILELEALSLLEALLGGEHANLGQSRQTPRPTPRAPSTHPTTACAPRLRRRRQPLAHTRHHSPRCASHPT
jgi:hypothetical protein